MKRWIWSKEQNPTASDVLYLYGAAMRMNGESDLKIQQELKREFAVDLQVVQEVIKKLNASELMTNIKHVPVGVGWLSVILGFYSTLASVISISLLANSIAFNLLVLPFLIAVGVGVNHLTRKIGEKLGITMSAMVLQEVELPNVDEIKSELQMLEIQRKATLVSMFAATSRQRGVEK